MPRIASLSSYKNVFLRLPFAQGRTEGVCASSAGYFSWVTCFPAFFFYFPGSFLHLPSAGSFLFLLYYELFLSFLFFTVSSFLSFELNTDGKCFGVAFLVLSNFNCKKEKYGSWVQRWCCSQGSPGSSNSATVKYHSPFKFKQNGLHFSLTDSDLRFFWIQHIYPKLPKIFMELRVDKVTYFDEFQELGQLIR